MRRACMGLQLLRQCQYAPPAALCSAPPPPARAHGWRRSLYTPAPPTAAAAAVGVAAAAGGVGGLQQDGDDALVCFYSDNWKVPLPPGHRFPMSKYRETRRLLEEDASLQGKITFHPGPEASEADLLLVHDAGYVRRFKNGHMTAAEMRNVGLPHSPELVGRSLSSSGSTIAATHLVLSGRHTMAANMAGGTHHAFRDRAEGFCIYNDIASGSAVAMRDYGLQRILIVDLDVHQGNGTSAIFEGEPRVVTFDMHGAKNYPYHSRMRSTYDVPLPDDTSDEEYLPQLQMWLAHLMDKHDPQLVFFQAGVDGLKGDSLGRLALSRHGLIQRNNQVYSMCEQASVPLVITMGGGYTKPIDASVEAHADVYRTAGYRYAAQRAAAAMRRARAAAG